PTLTLLASPAPAVTTSSNVSITGGTVHHLGQNPSPRKGSNPHPNLQQAIRNMNVHNQSPKTAVSTASTNPAAIAAGRVLLEARPNPSGLHSTFPNLTALANQSSAGPSPKKKVKLEEKPAASKEIDYQRDLVLDLKHKEMRELKENYVECLTEMFYLQSGGNMMDYLPWKKKPTPQLVHFLKSGNLDSDEEDELSQEKKINNEVKVITCEGSNIPLATPVAISTTLPPSVAALNQQVDPLGCGNVWRPVGGRHGMVFGHIVQTLVTTKPTLTMCTSQSPIQQSAVAPSMTGTSTLTTTTSLQNAVVTATTSGSNLPQLQSHLVANKDTKATTLLSPSIKSPSITSTSSSSAVKTVKSPPISPSLQSRHGNLIQYDGNLGVTSQEAIVERAKQEAQVMNRVAELRKEGLWSTRRLPKVQEPPRNKSHWDYLLEEMQWLAADFHQERKWKKAAARKVAKMVSKHFQELEQKEVKAEKEEAQKLKKIASQIAKQIREFWSNIEKVVQYKQQTRLDEKRKKALDLHLNFIVDQTEKYSSWLSEGLKRGSNSGSLVGSRGTTPDHSGDEDFSPEGNDEDDEETIDKEEKESGIDEDALQKESEQPIEELLKNVPKEVLEKPASLHEEGGSDEEVEEKDKEFKIKDGEEEADVEDTIAEQEKAEKKVDYSRELRDLEDESEMTMEELYKKYAGAYDSDFEMPESDYDSDDEESTDVEETDEEDDKEEEEEEEEEEMEEEAEEGKDDVGLEALVEDKEVESEQKEGELEEGPDKELTDIAAQAQSLQPKGYTLETATVKTQVPFLLKHKLREYQHVGLDWLATMYDKRLNGILADEMGLGKTIQTIALLAHLACDKGIWGPHLIVVPTSVMLNWEMEIKKWCPAFKILTYYGSQKERKQKRQGWTKTNAFHVCITSYKLVIQDHQSFRRKKWKYLILDEAQNIKNFKSQRWQTLLNFSSQRRLLLTGTPLQNSLMELWSLMHFLMPHVFQSHSEFKEWFANPLTGMIEGSHEYNEGLIKRLHKVLRPFLLRRLKVDVEKQMPQKYEHVVMCHLSKRQRFLYDDFMSQAKTKETLATGHFMSVINILMQLRKVCNHPSLFDPRPIVSPFKMEGIRLHVPSLAVNCLLYDPFKDIDLHALYPSLADMEKDLPAFIAHRVKRLQTPKKLIEEIDGNTETQQRLAKGKLKSHNLSSVSPMQMETGRVSPVIKSDTVTLMDSSSFISQNPVNGSVQLDPSSIPNVTHPPGVLQAKMVPQSGDGLGSHGLATSQPVTLQIQQTDQGARLMIPAGQISSLPAGYIQIVQTSQGQQFIATSTPISTTSPVIASIPTSSVMASNVVTTSSTVVNGPPTLTTVAASTSSIMVTSVNTQVRPSLGVQLPTSVTSTVKPVMRVPPMAVQTGATTQASTSSTTAVKTTMSTCTSMSTGEGALKCVRESMMKQRKTTPLFHIDLTEKRIEERVDKLEYLARTNRKHCELKPVYGRDLHDAVDVWRDTSQTTVIDNTWGGRGRSFCLNVHSPFSNSKLSDKYWTNTKVLSNLVHTPEMFLQELKEVLDRYVFLTPHVISPPISLHASHTDPSCMNDERSLRSKLQLECSPRTSCYHNIASRMLVQFPELRLIQYDCGKLQVLDILLRRLKSGGHRVLIFTQMTKMLDILEAFLNFHGHIYLRLDGTTKVEQRQFLMDRFNADKRIFTFILSTRSGGIGVNLTGADTVIFYDSDWNPTMDAQAQDRCHRIGQTRDVHIYRLISERTVEENILKKANQKRMLGDMAIEGGNFTTAILKEQTIKDLFVEPSGLGSLVEGKEEKKPEKEIKEMVKHVKEEKKKEQMAQSEKNIMAQFEKMLGKAEDETDAKAVDLVKAEQKAELAEFDENIPWDEKEELQKKEEEMSRAEQEIAMIDKELTPVERYAVIFMENELEPLAEELELAEEDIENAKKDWELGRLQALKEEEERRLEIEEDEMLYIYSREDAYNQVFISDVDKEHMPMWSPPTPPHDDNDIYIDQTLFFLYEPNIMPETQLPPVYIKKEHKKPKIESITTRKQKQRKEEQTRVPRSLFDRPSSQLLKMRREHKLKSSLLKPFRPVPPVVKQPSIDQGNDHPEWLIHEDWALLQAVQTLFDVPLNLLVVSPAHHPNWDLVADIVNTCSRVYRSAKQCKNRYENVIIPREEGRILYDMNPKKQSKKTKGIYKTKNNRPMRTSQIHLQDNHQALTMLYSLRWDSAKTIANKRPPPLKQTLVNPTLKNPKHATVLSENNINYENPLNPMSVAEIRAQRIQREKKQSQAQAQASAEQQLAAQRAQQAQGQTTQVQQVAGQTQVAVTAVAAGVAGQGVAQVAQTQLQPLQTAVSSAVLTGVVAKTASGQAVTLARTGVGQGNIVVNTQGGVAANFAAINRRMSQATASTVAQPTTVTVTGGLNPAIRAQRAAQPLTIQEITAIATQPGQTHVAQLATGQVARTQLQTTVTATQLAAGQRAPTAGTVQQQLTQAAVTKQHLTQQQILQLQQRQIQQQKLQQQQQQQQLKKLNLTQQQLKQIQQQQGRGQKTVIAQQLVTGLGQAAQLKTGQLQRQLTPEELARLKQQQELAKKQMTTQIIPQAQVQHLTQQGGVAGTSGTQLVKTVSTPAGGVPIPVSTVNINVSVPQQKGLTVAKGVSGANQIQQFKQMHMIQQRAQLGKQPQKITSLTQPVGKAQGIPLNAVQIIQQPPGAGGRHLTYQLQQIVQNSKSMIITSQPTIIATMTQSQQPTGQLVTKVVGTAPTAQIQTIASSVPLAGGTAVTAVATPVTHSQGAVATLSVAGTGQVNKPVTITTVTQQDSGQAVQVHPVASATTQQQPAQGGVTQQTVPQQATLTPQQQKVVTLAQGNQQVQQLQVTSGNLQQIQVSHSSSTPQPQQVAPPAPITMTVTLATPAPATAPSVPLPPQSVVQGNTVTSQAALACCCRPPAGDLTATTNTVAATIVVSGNQNYSSVCNEDSQSTTTSVTSNYLCDQVACSMNSCTYIPLL
ncbi:hypothetical protein FSP39_003020, partial [Pinctada imbricata]